MPKEERFAMANLTAGHLNALVKKVGGEVAVHRILRDELIVTERELGPISAPAPKPPLDTIIRVDRQLRPIYPDWAKPEWINSPEFIALEKGGSADYDLATRVEQWLHDGQKGGKWVKGQVIYDHLSSNHMLDSCLGLADGLEIQKKGIEFFRKFYSGKAVFLWRSVVQGRGRFGDLGVPYLYEGGGGVVLGWGWLDGGWGGRSPALRFAP